MMNLAAGLALAGALQTAINVTWRPKEHEMTSKRLPAVALVLGLVLGLVAVQPARAQQSDNHALHAVPAGKVVVDGKFDDWDLSGQIDVYANFKTRNNYSAKVAAMYDRDNFYLSIVWRDPTPMHNMVDSNFDIGSGWKSDCLQLRLKTDMVIGDVTCWYSTAAKHPVVNIAYGRFTGGRDKETDVNAFQAITDALKVGAQEAFLMGEDGKSYTQEIALPWKLITGQSAIVKATGKPYKEPKSYGPGDSFQMGMEFLWGPPDGRTFPIHRYADLLMPGKSSREFFWTAENDWGPVILEKAGNLKLERAEATASQAYLQKTDGPVALTYDLPQDGFVTLVVEDANGRRVRNLVGMAPRAKGRQTDFWDGLDEQGNLAAPGEYRWRGLFHPGIDPVYEASYGTAGIPPWDTADNTGAWMSDHNVPTAVACGKDTIVLAAAGSEGGWALIGTDYNGRKKWGERKFQGIRCVAVDETYLYAGMNPWGAKESLIGRLELKTAKYAPFETKPEALLMLPPTKEGEKATVTGIAVAGDRLAVALAGLDIVRFFDKKTAQPLGEVAVAKPAGLAVDAAGVLHAVSGEKIVKIAGNVVTPVVETELVQPMDVAIGADGSIFVADPGVNQMKGSEVGNVIAGAGAKANQVKVFDPKGAFVRAIGAKGGRPVLGPWNANGMLNPTSVDVDTQGRVWVIEENMWPKRVSVWTAQGEFVRDYIGPATYGGMGAAADPADKTRVFGNGCEFKLDYEKNQAEVVAARVSDNLVGDLVRHEGREYFMTKRGELYQRRGDTMVLVASIGGGRPNAGPEIDGLRKLGLEGMVQGDRNQSISWMWSDANDDGKPQPEEATVVQGAVLGLGYWGGYWLDERFNVYTAAPVVRTVPLKGWTAAGAPIWDLAQIRTVGKLGPSSGGIYLASGGQVIVGGETSMAAMRDDGTVLWTYKDKWSGVHGSHSAPIPESDDLLVGTLSCIGKADTGGPLGKLFALNSNMGRLYVFTTDGLLAAMVFQDGRVGPESWPNEAKRGAPLGGVSMGSEWFGGYFFKAEKTGEYYLIAGGTSYNLIKLNGLDKLQPLKGGKLAFAGEQLASAEKLVQQRAAQAAARNALTITTLKAPVTVDGKPDEFPKDSWVEWSGGQYKLRGALAVDANNLYAAWDVRGDANPMVNGGKDFTQLFITGDSVDLQLGTNPAADSKRGEPAVGDLRLLVSVMEGKPVAVLYRWKTAAADKKPVVFESPWRKQAVDSVMLLADATVSIQRGGDGYRVELSVPMAALGFKPEAGKGYKADLGVVFSDATGNDRAARVYWSNKATGLVNDVPGEIMSNPNLWGTARIAP